MDIESLKSLFWVVLWAGAFLLMMRYGCGIHMGRHRHGEHDAAGGKVTGKDPVCGMTVDAQHAAGASVHQGTTYYFCSVSCRDKFEQAPRRYVGGDTHAGPGQEAHHHG